MSDGDDEHPLWHSATLLLGAAVVLLQGFGIQSFESAVLVLLFFIMAEVSANRNNV